MKGIEKKIDENNQLIETNHIVKSNAMIESMYKLSAVEQKLILSLCSKISSSDNVFNNFEMSVDEFARFMGYDNKECKVNARLKKKCEELAGRTIEINRGTAQRPIWYIFNWFHHIQYETGKGIISLQFHEDLAPYLLNLQSQYTKYKLGYVMNFKSEYSFRIYELMKEYEKIGERTIPIEELRHYLYIDKDKYTKYSHFKERVIKPAMQEINKYSDLNITLIKEEKNGKKIIGLIFEIRPNNYKYPIDNLLDYTELREKTKAEIQKLLDDIIYKNYKIHFPPSKSDLFDKEAILQTYMEIKKGEFEETVIRTPIPYFEAVLIKKHGQMTGEEIKKTDIVRRQMELSRELSGLPEAREIVEYGIEEDEE